MKFLSLRAVYIAVYSSVLLVYPASATADTRPSADTTATVDLPFELSKFEGSELLAKKMQKFAELRLGSMKPRGQVVQLAYRLSPGNAPLEVIENYKQDLLGQNFNVVKESGGIYAPEAGKDGRTLIVKRNEPNGESFLQVESFTVRQNWKPGDARDYFGKSVKLQPEEVIVLVQLASPKAVEQKMVKEEVSYILKQLSSAGRVALYGIYFDTDKTELKAESEPVLSEVQKALKQDSSLRLMVVGHTDNTGATGHNQALSEGRAQAVMNALVARGIEEARLTAQGKGDSQPVASNESEDGRAKNRRVELVKVS